MEHQDTWCLILLFMEIKVNLGRGNQFDDGTPPILDDRSCVGS